MRGLSVRQYVCQRREPDKSVFFYLINSAEFRQAGGDFREAGGDHQAHHQVDKEGPVSETVC